MIYLKNIIENIKNLEELDPEVFVKDIFEENKKIHDENGYNDFISKSMEFYFNKNFTLISKMKEAKTEILLTIFGPVYVDENHNMYRKFKKYKLYNFGSKNMYDHLPFVMERIN